jgi:hypothetical protein
MINFLIFVRALQFWILTRFTGIEALLILGPAAQTETTFFLSRKLLELRAGAVRNSASSSSVLTRFVSASAGADSSVSATRSVRNSLLRRLVRPLLRVVAACQHQRELGSSWFCQLVLPVGAASWFCQLSLSLRWCCQVQICKFKFLEHAPRAKRVDEFGSHVSRSRDITGTFKKVQRHHTRGFSGIKIKKHTRCAQITAICGGRHH